MIFQNARRLKRSKKSTRDFFDKLYYHPAHGRVVIKSDIGSGSVYQHFLQGV